jgi:hypothetical protein
MKVLQVSDEEANEISDLLIGKVEDLHDKYGIKLPNPEKNDDPNPRTKENEHASVYGEDYDTLINDFKEVLVKRKLIKIVD